MSGMRRRAARRYSQFSVRALLAATLVCGVGAWAWMAYVEPYRQERKIAARLEELGASLKYEPEGPQWMRSLFGEENFLRIVEVELDWNSKATVADLAPLARLPRLRRLHLVEFPELSDEALRRVGSVTQLRGLWIVNSLSEPRVLPDGVRNLRELKHLQSLDLSDPGLDDRCLEHIGQMQGLRELRLSGSTITNAGLQSLGQLTELRKLALFSRQATDDGLRHLRALVELRDLRLIGFASDEGVRRMTSLTKLEMLVCGGNPKMASWVKPMYQRRAPLEFVDTPLCDVAEYLSAVHALSVRLDETALTAEQMVAPVNVTSGHVTLEEALEAILAPLEMDWAPDPPGIVLTTKDAAAARRPGLNALLRSAPKLKHVDVEWR